MKKILINLVFLANFMLFSATHSLYVGANVDASMLKGKRSDSASDNRPITVIFNDNKKIQKDGIYSGILIGYLFRNENLGIGPEFFYNFGKLESNIADNLVDPAGPTYTTFNVSYKIKNRTGAHIRVGYFLQNYFLYTLFGIQYQAFNFEAKAQQASAGIVTTDSYKSKKKNISSFSFEFGMQKNITENYSVGFEFKSVNFPKKTFAWSLNDVGETTLTSSFKYQLRSIGMKLIYIF